VLHETTYPPTSAAQSAVTDALFLPKRDVGMAGGVGGVGAQGEGRQLT